MPKKYLLFATNLDTLTEWGINSYVGTYRLGLCMEHVTLYDTGQIVEVNENGTLTLWLDWVLRDGLYRFSLNHGAPPNIEEAAHYWAEHLGGTVNG